MRSKGSRSPRRERAAAGSRGREKNKKRAGSATPCPEASPGPPRHHRRFVPVPAWRLSRARRRSLRRSAASRPYAGRSRRPLGAGPALRTRAEFLQKLSLAPKPPRPPPPARRRRGPVPAPAASPGPSHRWRWRVWPGGGGRCRRRWAGGRGGCGSALGQTTSISFLPLLYRSHRRRDGVRTLARSSSLARFDHSRTSDFLQIQSRLERQSRQTLDHGTVNMSQI